MNDTERSQLCFKIIMGSDKELKGRIVEAGPDKEKQIEILEEYKLEKQKE